MPLPNPGSIARRAAADAQTEEALSVREEGGNNRGRWVALILAVVHLAVGNPWCLAWVQLRLRKAAAALGLSLPSWVPLTGYTPAFVAAAKKQGLFFTTRDALTGKRSVQPGDLAFFWGRADGGFRIRHVGIVISVHDWGVMTVEGNTGPESGGKLNRDGDGVYKKRRDWTELGDVDRSGFVRLPF
jgi:hypothetical protein